MNIWMAAVGEFEAAIADCKNSCVSCNDSPVHSWDKGVAFYTGSLVQPQASACPPDSAVIQPHHAIEPRLSL
jgi:hypothetical protein